MRTSALVLAGTAAVALAAGCSGNSSGGSGAPATGGAPQHPTRLLGDVGHGGAFVIKLTDPQGAPITNLAAGSYQLVVDDESDIHDFHLNGSGVDVTTGVGTTGTQTFTVTFKPGTYTFVCDPHASQMHGSFRVT